MIVQTVGGPKEMTEEEIAAAREQFDRDVMKPEAWKELQQKVVSEGLAAWESVLKPRGTR